MYPWGTHILLTEFWQTKIRTNLFANFNFIILPYFPVSLSLFCLNLIYNVPSYIECTLMDKTMCELLFLAALHYHLICEIFTCIFFLCCSSCTRLSVAVAVYVFSSLPVGWTRKNWRSALKCFVLETYFLVQSLRQIKMDFQIKTRTLFNDMS